MGIEVKQRIAWIDIYKAICIILVVVGHATGLFNDYIYQFHMAAFFFISGYTSKIWKRNLEEMVVDKSRTLLLPFLTMIVAFDIIRATIAFFSKNLTFGAALKSILLNFKDFFVYGYAPSLLGAGWFLLALFFVFLIQRMIWRAAEEKHTSLVLIFTVFVYVLGYYLQKYGFRNPHGFDMATVGQLFFGIGAFLSKHNTLELLRKQKWRYAVYAVGGGWMLFAKWLGGRVAGGARVEYPLRSYPNVWMTALVPLGGILLVFGISELIGRLGNNVIRPFSIVGGATLGVLFLHFVGFKLATILLLPFKVTVWQDVNALVLPASALSHGWCWIFYTVVSLLFSVAAWRLLMLIPCVNVLLGKQKSAKKKDAAV